MSWTGRSLPDATDNYLDHLYDNPDADKTLVEQRLAELDAQVERYRTVLSLGGVNPAECPAALVAAGFNPTYAAQKCMTAAANGEIYACCSAKLVELDYNHAYAGQKCLAAGSKGRTFSQCVEAMLTQNYKHDYAATYCLNNG